MRIEEATVSQTIAQQVDEFDVGFTAQIGPELTAVFADEQRDLTTAGTPRTVQVGDRLPAGTLLTPDGAQVPLAEAAPGAASVLVFYRGAWCPYCNITLRHYDKTLAPGLAERGVSLIAISPQTPDGSAAAVTNGELGFTVVSDPANAFAGALGIVTAPSAEAQDAHTALGFAVKDSNADDTPAIPYPTVIVVGADRVVRFVDIHIDYTTRTETADILAAVDAR